MPALAIQLNDPNTNAHNVRTAHPASAHLAGTSTGAVLVRLAGVRLINVCANGLHGMKESVGHVRLLLAIS